MIRLIGPAQRANACAKVMAAPDGYVVRITEPTRSLDQNAKLHAMLDDIVRQKPMGWKKDRETWKAIMLRSLGYEVRFEHDVYGNIFPLGLKTSGLKVKQMAELIEFIYSFGAEQGVVWSEPMDERAA
jgi:hypothetical protein